MRWMVTRSRDALGCRRCPRATRSTTRRGASGPLVEGRVPEIAHPAPAPARRALAAEARRPRRHARRRPRQAPLRALRGRPRDPLAPAHDRLVGHVPRRPALAPRAPPRLARPAHRRGRGRPVRRAGARAADRVAHALRPPPGDARARHPRPRARRAGDPRAPARRRPDAPDRRRPARPAHDRGHRQPLEVRGLLRRGDRPVAAGRRASATTRRCAIVRAARPGMQQSALRRDAGRCTASSTAGPGRPCPRCGAPIRSRGQGDDNRLTYWCAGCQR